MIIGRYVDQESTINDIPEENILIHYFGISKIPCLIKSPLRDETRPSFSFYKTSSGHIRCKDFSTGENYSLIGLLEKKFNMNFADIVEKIKKEVDKTPKQFTFTITCDNLDEIMDKHAIAGRVNVDIVKRNPEPRDRIYWESYGIDVKLLNDAHVFPISGYCTTRDGKPDSYTFRADLYAYAFGECIDGEWRYKIYQPYNKKGYKWFSTFYNSVISLKDMLPETGDKLIICSSLKDALCVRSQLGIPTIATQGEGCRMKESDVQDLKSRFKKIFVTFDSDEPGIEGTFKLAKANNFIPVVIDFGEQKDFSDYYKSLKNKETFKEFKKYYEETN